MSRVSRALGETADAARFSTAAVAIAARFNLDYLSATGVYRENKTCTKGQVCGTYHGQFARQDSLCPACGETQCQCFTTPVQASQALPLFLGIVPPSNRSTVLQQLRANVEASKAMLVGMQGVEWFLFALSDNGLVDLAFETVMRTEEPSYRLRQTMTRHVLIQ